MKDRYNNERGRSLGGLGVSRSVMATRPSRRLFPTLARYVLVAALLAVLSVAWAFSRNPLPLASQLPDRVAWYASITLPRGREWYDPLLFWRRPVRQESSAAGLVAWLNVVNWDRASFADDLAPLFSGNLELAQASDREVVLSARLRDPDAWFALVGALGAEGSVETSEIPLGGLWKGIAPQHESWAWMVRDRALYLASSASVFDELQKNEPNTVLRALREAGSRGAAGTWYIKSLEVALARNPYLAVLFEGAQFPVVLDIAVSQGNITFSPPKSPDTGLSSTAMSRLESLYASRDAGVGLYAERAGLLYDTWRSALSDDALLELSDAEALFGALYGAERGALSESLKDSELVFLLSAPEGAPEGEFDWLAAFSNAPEDTLAPVAEALFAIRHPITVPIALADGSSMVELRADTDGLVWDRVSVAYEGDELSFSSLQGAGEQRGYALGTIPGLGTVLTSSISMIDRVLSPQGEFSAPPEPDACNPGAPLRASIRISGIFLQRLLTNVPAERLVVSSASEGGLFGCLLLEPDE